MATASERWGSRRVVLIVLGALLCLFALTCVTGGGWALWKDRVDRDSHGYVSFGSTDLRTGQYAIVGDLKGDGPSWLYGKSIIGDTRVRATSQSQQPLFIGIARKSDVLDYLRGAGYATIYSFAVTDKTTHPGAAPQGPPSSESIWATWTQGGGEQTLLWTPRDGDWSIVFMNADASANVDVHGDASAKLPPLPWVAGGLLIIGGATGLTGVWLLVRNLRRDDEPAVTEPDVSHEPTPDRVPVGANS
jgi:hypothetical protein